MIGINEKRQIRVTEGNIRNSHLYINGHYDFFPRDCIGGAKRSSKAPLGIEISLDGLNETVNTDIGSNPRTGKPRGYFRGRTWVRKFFEHHSIQAGAVLSLERLSGRKYFLSVESSATFLSTTQFRAAEFFAGIGLVRLALEKQGIQVVFANDIDPAKAEMYRHNWPMDDHLIVADIHSLKACDLPRCELFTASFPCNDLSIAGKWEGLNGKESSAFWGLITLLRDLNEHRPKIVMLENVVGFLMSRGGRDFAQALVALNEFGYSVDALILNAIHWTPQSRARLFVIAKMLNKDCQRRKFALVSDVRPQSLIDFIAGHPEIDWDIGEMPPLPKPTAKLADIIEALPDDDPHWWSKERTEYFMNQMSERHMKDARRMIEGKSINYATAFRRVRNARSMAELRTDGIAGCLRTPRGGSGRQILFKAGRGRYQVRLLTARECARLQGVPDSYVIDVPLNQALFGFGDAVCVPAIEWIARNCFTKLLSAAGSAVPAR
jgi:DNA (cytosine-5)-methyltransferase 1